MAAFSKFACILSAALLQHHLLGFEIAQLEFHHYVFVSNVLNRYLCQYLDQAHEVFCVFAGINHSVIHSSNSEWTIQ